MARRPVFDRPIAHRGLHDRAAGVIENSAAAFEAAIAADYAIECDLQLSRDGVPVVFHDDELLRVTGQNGPLNALDADAITALPLIGSAAGNCPMRFVDFLALVGGRATVQVELKRQGTARAGAALADAAARAVIGYGGPLAFMSFDPNLVMAVRHAGFHGPCGIITYRYPKGDSDDGNLNGLERFVLRHLLHSPWTRYDFISCELASLSLPAVRLMRALGVPVTTWTIRSAEEARMAAGAADQIVFEGFLPNG